MIIRIGAGCLATMIGAGIFAGDTLPSSHRHVPAIIRERHGNQVTSTNWSGYAVTGASGSVSDVKGSWIVPAVTCTGTAAYSSFWVGIDGYTSNTVEQIGTDSDCQGGKAQYYAWYEFYPHGSYNINSLNVQPGDVISAEVRAGAKGSFTVTITNTTRTTEKPFSVTTKVGSAQQSSAEWVVEAPWSGGVLPLANFATAKFGQDNTFLSGTCYATINNLTNPIGKFANFDQMTMVTSSGVNKAVPSGPSSDGSSFTDAWVSPGP